MKMQLGRFLQMCVVRRREERLREGLRDYGLPFFFPRGILKTRPGSRPSRPWPAFKECAKTPISGSAALRPHLFQASNAPGVLSPFACFKVAKNDRERISPSPLRFNREGGGAEREASIVHLEAGSHVKSR